MSVNQFVERLLGLNQNTHRDPGLTQGAEFNILQKQIIDDSKNAYLEKLFVLSDKKFIGIVNLQNEFEKLMKDYLNVHYLKNNNINKAKI